MNRKYAFGRMLGLCILMSLVLQGAAYAAMPAIYGSDAKALKGRKVAVNAVFNITLSAVSNQTVTVNYATANGTAQSGTDYTAVSGTLTIPANTRSTTVTVPVLSGSASGSNKTFYLDLSSPLNATLGNSRATGTILESSPSLAFSSPQSLGRYQFLYEDYVGSNLYPAINMSYDMELADFNKDGNLDLLVPATGSYESHVWLFRGNGDGSFKAPSVLGSTNYATGTRPLAIGDLNNDGFTDYVVANSGTTSSDGRIDIVFYNAGGITGTSVTIGNYPMAVTLADLNNDNFLDIAVACDYGSGASNTTKVRILLNNGDGTFATTPIELDTASNGVMGITAANFNNNGGIDLAVTLSNTNKIAIFYNLGNMSFSGVNLTPVDTYPTGIASGDLNGDTYPDIITANYNSRNVSVVIKRPNATAAVFNAVNYDVGIQPYHIKLIDFDGDGFPDIYASNSDGAVILQNLQDGTFSQPMFIADNSVGATAGDIDGDGDVDLIQSSDGAGRIRIQPNLKIERALFVPIEEKLHVTNSANIASFLINADFSGSGYDDIIAAMPGYGGTSFTLYHYKNQNGTLADPQLLYSGAISSGRQAAVADFNGDGTLDLAIASSTGAAGVNLFVNNGSGTLATAGTVDTRTGVNSLIALDVDGDDDQDLVVSHTLGSISILRNDGNGVFTLSYPTDSELPTKSLSAGHLASGKFFSGSTSDLAVAVAEGIAILPATGLSFDSATILPLTGTPKIIIAGDFNGDGTTDLAAIIPTLGELAVVLNDGAERFADPVYFTADANLSSLSSADMDNDGDIDLLLTSNNGDIQIFNNDGTGLFTLLSRISPHGSSIDRTVTFANLDGNSYPDFVTGELFPQVFADNRFGLFSYRNVMQLDVPKLAALSINPASTSVSTPVTATITLTANAPTGGARVLLSNNNGCATVPVSVLVPQGAVTADFTITPSSDCEDRSVLVGAIFMGSYRAARLYVLPIVPSSVTITPSTVLGGESLSVTVTLNAPAKASGMNITLASNSAKLQLPYTSTTIAAGKTSLTFPVTTKAVADVTIASVTASNTKGSANGSVTLNPIAGSVAVEAPVTISQNFGNGLVADDFNKDNKPDLAYTWYGLSVASGNGNGSFEAATSAPAPYTTKIAKGDFDKDGYPDLAVLNPGTPSSVSIFINDKNGGFLPKVDYTTDGNNSSDIAIGDFNGDGFPDIIIANPSGPSSRFSILLNNGSGSFVNGVSNNEAFYMPQALVTGDFNGDDIIDIATVRGLIVTILSGNSDVNGKGDGTFQVSSEIPLTESGGYPLCNQIAAADLNNDVLPDLVLSCHIDGTSDSKEIRTFRNSGFGFVPAGSVDLIMDPGGNWHNIPFTIADFNGDGAPDIAVAYSQYNTPGHISIALNNGAGLFSTAFSFPASVHPAGIVAADFDKDGDLDLVVVHNGADVTGKLYFYSNALLTPTADIAVALSDAPDPVNTSGTLTYTATVTNNNANTSKSVVLSDTLPAGTTFVSGTTSKGSCSHTNGIVTCTIGDVTSTDAVTVTIRVTAPASPDSLTNTVTLTSQTGDPNSANNSASASTQVSHPAQTLTVYKIGSGDGSVSPGSGLLAWNGTTGTESYPYGTVVTLTAPPAEGSIFVGWGDSCPGTGTCQVTLTAAVQVTAWFEPIPVDAVCGVNPVNPIPTVPVNLCEQGFATAVSGNGPWTWGCQGLWGGSDATCSASYGLITSHPQNVWIQSGQTATLSVSATGTVPLSYQWYLGTSGDTSAPIEGAIQVSYTTPVLTAGTSYWVRVTNPEGSTDSTTTRVSGKGLGFFAYAAVSASGNIKVIDETGAVMTNIPVAGAPIGVAISPDGDHVYVTSLGTNMVRRISTLTNTVENTINLGLASGIYGIAVGPQATFVSDLYSTTQVYSINNQTLAVSTLPQSPPGYGRGVAFNPDYSKVFVARGSYISFLNSSTGATLGTYSVSGCSAEGVITSPDGGKLYISCSNNGAVYIMSTTTGALLLPIQTQGLYLAGMALDPDLNRLYVANRNGSVFVINTLNDSVSATIPVSGTPYGLSLSPDRSQLFVAQSNGNSMAIIDTATMNITTSVPLGGYLELFGTFTSGDATPDAFSFPDGTDVLLSSPIDSDPVTVAGVDGPVRIFVSGGTYSINGGAFTSVTGKVKNGDSVVVRVTSSDLINTAASAQLNIGTASAVFTATTANPEVGVCGSSNGGQFDTIPDSGLCSAGTPGPVSGTGPWTWICSGLHGGADSEPCSATISQYQLAITFGGDGGTLIQSTPPGIFCYAAAPAESCSYSYNYGTAVELTAAHSGISELTGWTNADTADGNPVTITMDVGKTVTAHFAPISKPVLIYGKIGYDSLGLALSTYQNSDSIMLKSTYNPSPENVLFDQPNTIELIGGYDDSWSLLQGSSSLITGTLKVKAGRVTVKGIKIRP